MSRAVGVFGSCLTRSRKRAHCSGVEGKWEASVECEFMGRLDSPVHQKESSLGDVESENGKDLRPDLQDEGRSQETWEIKIWK